MKKIFSFILIFTTLFILVGCGEKSYTTEEFHYIVENGGLSLSECLIDNPVDVVIPEVEGNGKTVLSIDDMVFYEMPYLESVVIPNSVKYVGSSCFAYDKKLTSVTLSSSMTLISIRTFLLCTSLEYVNIPEGVKKIEMHAFNKCSALNTIIIPKSIIEIDSSAFYGCTSLEYAFYAGSLEDFSKVNVDSYYNSDLLDNIYYYSEEYKEGNYWHYDNGVAVSW